MATEAMSDQKDFLYKYRAIDENNIDWSRRIFTHNELYFATRDQFNDPFDCKFYYSFSSSAGDVKKYLRRGLKRNFPNWNRQQRESFIAENLQMFERREK